MASAAATNSEEPQLKKNIDTELTSIHSLPHDLLVTCLSRVSRLHYPSLSLVSKSFRSLIASSELYKTRSLLNRKETCLYVCLQYPSDLCPRWFTLCHRTLISKKKKKKKKKESSRYVLAPISICNSPPLQWSHLIDLDHKLYAISKPMEAVPRSNSLWDCRTHTWLDDSPFDGDLHLPGSREDPGSICMIKNRIYYYCSNGEFQWSDGQTRRKVEGLEGLPKLASYSSVKMIDYGGKLMVFWDKYLPLSWFREKMIWCAVISLEKRGSEEIWGNVEWFNAVLTVPNSYKFVYAIAATL